VAEVGPPGTELVWADSQFLIAQEVPDEGLPLWPGGDSDHDITAADPAAAYGAGLTPRPLRQTVAELHAAEGAAPTSPRPGTGLTPEQEAGLLTRWRQSAG